MGFSFFKEYKNWLEVTRNEQFFCSCLYHTIKDNENNFIKWLKNNQVDWKRKLLFTEEETDCEWEIGYEVCFYRDYFFKFNKGSIQNSEYSQKRTFDLCLFSEKRIIIIEAKAQQSFKTKEIETYRKDVSNIKSLLGDGIQVNFLALTSSRYLLNQSKSGDNHLLDIFDGFITWEKLYYEYENRAFINAENCYKN